MGINVRVSDVSSDVMIRATESREQREADMRRRVRAGEMTLIDYLVHVRGYKPDHAMKVAPQFERAIFGA